VAKAQKTNMPKQILSASLKERNPPFSFLALIQPNMAKPIGITYERNAAGLPKKAVPPGIG